MAGSTLTSKARPALGLGLVLLSCRPDSSSAPAADLVLRHGAVYTVDASRSWAEAVAIRGGRIVYVGPDGGVTPLVGPQTTVIDLAGRMVLPGFRDSHVHAALAGLEMGECLLNDLTTPEQILGAIAEYARQNPGAAWVRGVGWDLPVFPEANPSKTLLDRVVSDRPAYMEAADGHSAWVNSRALAEAGITKATPDPPGGRIERDPRTGEPSGTLRENAIDLVVRLLPEYTMVEKEAGILRMLPAANRLGITALYEARSDSSELAAYLELDHRAQLTARVVAAMYLDPAKEESQIGRLKAWRERFRSPHLRAIAVKLYADGVIESGTAALLEPYVGRPGNRGPSDFEPETFDRLVAALDRAGFQVHVHAVGDRAVRMALDGFAAARSANGSRDSRHLIAHLQLVDPVDVPRFRELGVIADIQGLWAYPDDYITKLAAPKLGAARSRRIYPNGSLARSGAVLVGGSDWSVSSLNPLDAIQVAITRRDLDSGPGAGWLPDQTVGLPTMLAAYTIEGAYAVFEEGISGSLEVGKAADLIVLDRNLFAVPVTEIHRAKVLLTLLEGREVFRDSAALSAVKR